MPPQEEMVHDEYRYAKLAGNDQVFEILADRLKDLFVPGPSLRDAKLARFKPEDVRRLEIRTAGSRSRSGQGQGQQVEDREAIDRRRRSAANHRIARQASTWQASGKEVHRQRRTPRPTGSISRQPRSP